MIVRVALVVWATLLMSPFAASAACLTCAQLCGPINDVGAQSFARCMSACKPPNPSSCKPGPNGGGLVGPAQPGTAAVAQHGIAAPIYVNLYWDNDWDSDNRSMPVSNLEIFMNALLSSSYFVGMAEYGVGAPSYGGGFLPAPACTQRAPDHVGFWDPINPSIIGFIQCEMQHANIPKGPNVIYNVLLPSTSLEQDGGAELLLLAPISGLQLAGLLSFGFDGIGSLTACVNVGVSWHYHGVPFSGFSDALPQFLQGSPIYTIESANPKCGKFLANLTHEMVEAASDPFPDLSVIGNPGNTEISDLCPSGPFSTPFAGLGGPQPFLNQVQVSPYISNALAGVCISGFADNTSPVINSVQATGYGSGLSLTIAGSGFGMGISPGMLTAMQKAGLQGLLPYISITDQNENPVWEAGNAFAGNFLRMSSVSWSDKLIIINGMSPFDGPNTMKPGDQISVFVCNPLSGNCTQGLGTLPGKGSYPATLTITVAVTSAPGVALNSGANLLIDGNAVATNVVNGQTVGPLNLPLGRHTVSSTIPTIQPTRGGTVVTSTFSGDCTGGIVTLLGAQSQSCIVMTKASPFGTGSCKTRCEAQCGPEADVGVAQYTTCNSNCLANGCQ